MSRRSGTLQLTTPVESGEIVFRAGRVVAGYRTNAAGSLGEGLLEARVIAPTMYQEMLAAQKSGKRGLELFAAFQINEESLNGALEALLKRLIFTMFDWNEGTFSFVLEESPDVWRGFALESMRVVCESGLNPQYLAIEGARIRDEKTKEDPLDSFLARGEPTAEERLTNSQASVEQMAARLRSAADLPANSVRNSTADTSGDDDFMAGTFASEEPASSAAPMAQEAKAPQTVTATLAEIAAQPSPQANAAIASAGVTDSGEVIPFPQERVRREGKTEAAPAPSLNVPSPAAFAPVNMPAAPAPIVPAPAAVAVPVATSVGAQNFAAGARLLVVDDDAQVTRAIQQALGSRFAQMITADTVQEAITLIERAPQGLVVASDLIIARSDGRGILGGIEILERVRKVSADMPVVLFTDYQNEEAEAKARTLGVVDVLKKPRKAQVQSAKEGAAGPLDEFLQALDQALSPYIREALPGDLEEPGPSAVPGVVDTAPPVDAEPSEPPAQLEIQQPQVLPQHEASSIITTSLSDSPILAPPRDYDLASEIAGEMDDFGSTLDQDLPPAVMSGGEMSTLRSMLAELIDPANRDTITLLVLRFASHLVERAGLFLATRRAFVGLGGFAQEESSDQFVARVRRIQVPVEHESVFGRVSRFRAIIRGPLKELEGNRRLIDGLGGVWPGEVLAAPLISGDRVAAILYGDNPSKKPLGPIDSLEIFLQQAGLAMDRALLERKLEDSKKKQGGNE